jgi:hypothetical protein
MKKQILALLVAVGLIGSVHSAKGSVIAAQWQLNGNANDFLGYSDGLASNVQWITGTDAHGNSRSMGYFNGTSSISVAANSHLYLPSTGFSITAWVKPDTLIPTSINSPYSVLMAGGDESASAYTLTFSQDAVRSQLQGNSYSYQTWSASIQAGNWYLLGLTYDGLNQFAYLNGVQLGNIENVGLPASITPYQFTDPLKIGIDINSAGPWFQGYMYDVTLYNAALSASEVSQLYAIPEPSTYALFGIGAIGLLMVLRRKRTG